MAKTRGRVCKRGSLPSSKMWRLRVPFKEDPHAGPCIPSRVTLRVSTFPRPCWRLYQDLNRRWHNLIIQLHARTYPKNFRKQKTLGFYEFRSSKLCKSITNLASREKACLRLGLMAIKSHLLQDFREFEFYSNERTSTKLQWAGMYMHQCFLEWWNLHISSLFKWLRRAPGSFTQSQSSRAIETSN